MRARGLLAKTAHEKITMRHKGSIRPAAKVSFTGEEIKSLREKCYLSQAVCELPEFDAGYVSQLERGAKRPNGPALVLLDEHSTQRTRCNFVVAHIHDEP